MAGRQERVLSISIFITYILLFSTIVDAVTWRRVTRPTVKHQDLPSTSQKSITIPATKFTTKFPVVWRKSTVIRRSTDYAENEASGDESDELNEASSEKKEDLKDLENDSEVKPLVPGSRPGFWFDSSRRKKPATLLRPGTRRNSLFPTRSSTTVAPTTVSVTPVTVIPRTPPNVLNAKAKNTSGKLFGRNKSTNSPVVFRRRLKTTRAPRISSTTESIGKESDESDNQLAETRNDTEIEKETEDFSKDLTNNNTESDDMKFKRPKFNIRRRPYNGTRLSWTRKRIPGSITTAVPQQLTTTAAPTIKTKDYERFLRKTTQFPRTRVKSKPNATSTSIRTRVTAKPSAAANKKSPTKITPESTLENDYYDEKLETEVVSSETDSDENDFVDEPTTSTRENYGLREVSKVQSKPKVRTTVEPFFITRDYGRVVTAFAEIKTKIEDSETSTTAAPITRKNNEYELLENKKYDADAAHTSKKAKKRIKIKATKAPASITTVPDIRENIEKEYETENEDIDSSFEYVDDFKSKFLRTTEVPTTTDRNEKFSGEKIVASKVSTTRRPVTFPTVPPIDLKNNAYVVWSVGHGGSGWSYQKHGETVKWSAQNSEAEGDSWSVEAKDVKDTKYTDFDNPWLPIRNTTINYQNNNEKVNSTIKVAENWEDFYPATYVPNIPFKNETSLNFNRVTNSLDLPQENANDSFAQFNLQSNSAFSDNSTLLLSNFQQPIMQQPQYNSFVSQTPEPISPTLEDQFNAQVEGIINQYPVVPDYPYIAEIRDTKNIPTVTTKTPTTKFYDYQDYAPQSNRNKANLPVTPPSTFYEPQLIQDPQVNQYINNLKQDDIALSYNVFTEESDQSSNQLSSDNLSYQKPQSNIPPELAKAVVQAKKWQVVGSGGPEGWSLLNEDGELEWKIHNVDGKWKISSAEELIKKENPVQIATYVVNNQNSKAEKQGFSNDLPKIWTLEDDYEKWRAVSTERGIPSVESSKEVSLSSQEYDYESDESDSDYYSDEDDYSSQPVSKESVPYQPSDYYGNSPVWNQYDENQRIRMQNENAPYSRNIEIANTRDDAIAAWKSLIAQQGHWKVSGDINERLGTYSRLNTNHFQNRGENAEDGVSVSSPRRENSNSNQKFQNTKQNVEKYRNVHRYQKQSNDFAEDGRSSTDSLINLKVQDGEILNYDSKNGNKQSEGHQHTSNIKSSVGYYDSLPDSTESYRNVHLIEKITANNKQESRQTQPKNEFTDQTYEVKRKDHKYYISRNNPHELTQYQNTRNNMDRHHESAPQENQQTQQKEEFTDQIYAVKRQDHKHDHIRSNHQELTQLQNTRNNIAKQGFYVRDANPYAYDQSPTKDQKENDEKKKNPSEFFENIFESHAHTKSKDYSKLDSLIRKLEAIHTESQGRAVIDLTALLTRMREKRNFTSTASGLDSLQKENQRVQSGQSSSYNDKDNVLEMKGKINQMETQHARVENDFDSKIKSLGNSNGSLSLYNNDIVKNQKDASNSPQKGEIIDDENSSKNIKSQYFRLRHSLKSNRRRRRRPGSKLSNRKLRRPSSNQSIAVNENKFVNTNPSEVGYEFRSTTVKPEKNEEQQTRYSNYYERDGRLQKLRSDHTKRKERRPSSNQTIAVNGNTYIEAKPSEGSSYKFRSTTIKPERNKEEQNRFSNYYERDGRLQKLRSDHTDTSSSEEIFMNLRGNKEIKPRDNRRQRKQPLRKNKNPYHPPPIVLKGETEIEDEEDGSKKSRKIIVIDYAGAQKKKSSVDKKDLELIIRNVKHRRAEIYDGIKDNKS